MKKEVIIFAVMIIGSLVSYFVLHQPIWVSSLIIGLGLIFFLVQSVRK